MLEKEGNKLSLHRLRVNYFFGGGGGGGGGAGGTGGFGIEGGTLPVGLVEPAVTGLTGQTLIDIQFPLYRQ